jgi:AcrR family transcriptional regulator
VATDLFYANGFNATGVEKIICEAGVSKKTLYNHFTSKNELILAVLRKKDEMFRNDFVRRIEKLSTTPKGRLLAIFDALDQWFKDKDFCGCLFINAAAEFSQENDPRYIVCKEHKKLICDYIHKLTKSAGAKNAEELAQQINLLAEGAIVSANVGGDKNSAKKAQKIAQILLNAAEV